MFSQRLKNFKVIDQSNLMGLQVFVLLKKGFPEEMVKVIETEDIKLGSMKMGNKGGI